MYSLTQISRPLRGRLDPLPIEGGKVDLSESVADYPCSIFLSRFSLQKKRLDKVLLKAMIGKSYRRRIPSRSSD